MPKYWTKLNDKGELIARINKKTKRGEYYLSSAAKKQTEYISSIELIGFEKMPSGLFTSGAGLTSSGYFLAKELFDKWQTKIRITITADGQSQIKRQGRGVSLQINHTDLRRLNEFFRRTRAQGTAQVRGNIQGFLSFLSPRFFPAEKSDLSYNYTGGEMSSLLEKEDILDNLDDSDRESLNNFIPQYIFRIPLTLRSDKKLKVIFDLVDAGKQIYLKEIIEEFEKRLRATIQNENRWQEFLRKYILIFRNSYGEVLEKESVTLSGKFPDFMLIDPYNYLDIYEIKRPDTPLLGFDSSRGNYYWDKEISKAIAQVENYIHQIQRNSDALINDIRKKKGLDISIVRPRGYIIAGKREQIKNTTMEDFFRILNESLKNVDILFYDDLLEGLKTFLSRISQ